MELPGPPWGWGRGGRELESPFRSKRGKKGGYGREGE